MVWAVASALTGTRLAGAISVASLQHLIAEVRRANRARAQPDMMLQLILEKAENLQAHSTRWLAAPLPEADRVPLAETFWDWDLYSEGQLLDRVRSVYQGALVGYEQLVAHWFPNFHAWLRIYATLPACLHGWIVLHPPPRGPWMRWYLTPVMG
jgi:hypothetical protein